jgi:hypothetical protein
MDRGYLADIADDFQHTESSWLPIAFRGKYEGSKKTADTDVIFGNIREMNALADADTETLRISTDTKATINIGEYSKHGRSRGLEPVKAWDHDMRKKEKLILGGILEPMSGKTFLFFTSSYKTSDFIVDGFFLWWNERKQDLNNIAWIIHKFLLINLLFQYISMLIIFEGASLFLMVYFLFTSRPNKETDMIQEVRPDETNIPEIITPLPKAEVKLGNIGDKSVILNFEGGNMSSDTGALLLLEVESQIGIIRAMTEVIPDGRDARYIKHTLTDLLIQRIAQIGCGYEDANDCNELRNDPIFKMLADRYPEIGEALASQPTMSRFENRISRTTLYRLALVFADVFVASYAAPPPVIVIDFDDTEDKVYGKQQLSLFNGYYDDYCFMPLHVYEGLSGKLITTILKPGKRSDGKQMLSIVKRMVCYLRNQWPDTLIIFRGDSHFAYPEVMEYIEMTDNTMYIIGLTGNSRLMKDADALVERATQLYNKYGMKIVLFHSFYYQAATWNRLRRVVVKVEVSELGKNIRFIVTNMEEAKTTVLYRDIYCARGEDELFIKEHKLYLKSDRTSCHKFVANQFRLFLHSAAYVLIHTLKTEVLKATPFANASFETIRNRIFKINSQVRELKTRIKIELHSSFPLKDILLRTFNLFNCLKSPG